MKNSCNFEGIIIKNVSPKDIYVTDSGSKVLNITILVKSEPKTKDGQSYERFDFAQLVLWDDLAEKAVSLTKGTRIKTATRMQSRRYMTKNGNRYVTEFVAETLEATNPDTKSVRKRA